MDALRVRSKFLVVAPDRCLHPGQFVIRRGRVVEVTERLTQPADVDLGDAVVLPGLVNAHTHLEFSSLTEPFAAGTNFPHWISQVVEYRRSLSEPKFSPGPQAPLNHLQSTLAAGLRESFSRGTVLVGDIVTPPWQASLLPQPADFADMRSSPHAGSSQLAQFTVKGQEHLEGLGFPRVLPMREVLGMSAERLQASWQWAQGPAPQAASEIIVGQGLSPHAPYSIYFPGLKTLLGNVAPTTVVAMHVAESPAELEWIDAQTGPFQEVFDRLGIVPAARPPAVDQCIELLSRWQQALLIHGNFLTPSQIDQIASASAITVVFCPRTHAHFGHARYPLDALRAAGVRIALATDSRASNPDLSLWDELVQVKRLYPHLTGCELLQWITKAPARALGLEHDFGSLEPGRLAAACVARAQPQWNARNLLDEMSEHSAAELALAPLCSRFCSGR